MYRAVFVTLSLIAATTVAGAEEQTYRVPIDAAVEIDRGELAVTVTSSDRDATRAESQHIQILAELTKTNDNLEKTANAAFSWKWYEIVSAGLLLLTVVFSALSWRTARKGAQNLQETQKRELQGYVGIEAAKFAGLDSRPPRPVVLLRVTNFGETPIRFLKADLQFRVLPLDSAATVYENSIKEEEGAILNAQDSHTMDLGFQDQLSDETLDLLKSGDAELEYVYSASYKDIFGKTHSISSAAFCKNANSKATIDPLRTCASYFDA